MEPWHNLAAGIAVPPQCNSLRIDPVQLLGELCRITVAPRSATPVRTAVLKASSLLTRAIYVGMDVDRERIVASVARCSVDTDGDAGFAKYLSRQSFL